MKVHVQKIGSIWHGTIDDYPDIDVRGLTEEIARRKVEDLARTLPPSVETPRNDHARIPSRPSRSRRDRR